ncbi:MAG: hypothetical protein COB67_04765 [SAR324 cluster bacterium]|uniref:Cytochrome c oxidase assembly protein n=1 Tax=SAR324 cluster bacterium TaxID=2024889 RepID=A0A2A4T721_9DELT|nr:MAG: hypothetical protein COB67_04765 [SAR324 cluster bacterium]
MLINTVYAHGVLEYSSEDSWWEYWSFDPSLLVILVITILYFRGLQLYQKSGTQLIRTWRVASFCLGGLTCFTALSSPLDFWADYSFSAHMAQHLLLSMVAVPLLLLGLPWIPLLKGLPRGVLRDTSLSVIQSKPYRFVKNLIQRPGFAFCVYCLAFWLWHWPVLYDLALENTFWHWVEHGTFFWSAVFFWGDLIGVLPRKKPLANPIKLIWLVLAIIQNSALSALIIYSEGGLYGYQEDKGLLGMSLVQDQITGGLLMWGVGSMMYWGVFSWIFFQMAHQEREPKLKEESSTLKMV